MSFTMKLKQRIILVGVTTTWIILSMTFVMHHYVQNYSNTIKFSPADSMDTVSRMKARLAQKDITRPHNRKFNKQSVAASNFSMQDSNRAVEIEMNNAEYEDLLKKRDAFVQTLDQHSLRPYEKIRVQFGSQFLGLTPECSESNMLRDNGEYRGKFPDLLQFLAGSNPLEEKPQKNRITLQEIHGIENTENLTTLELFHVSISDVDMYAEDDPNVEALLNHMARLPIVHVEEKQGGTQLKLILTFQDGSQALFKPMRFDRDKETEPNHFYFVDYERHTSEIAAFHLDRILGFRRCPPVVGRKLNITSEIYAVAEDDLIRTFFISPAKNICFHGTCSYYCDTSHAICGRPDTVEGSLAAFLPPDALSGRKSWKNPWKRSYHKRRKAEFEKNPKFCKVVRQRPKYKNTKRLADLVDTSILDFLMGNMDRHHYETFKVFGNDSFIIHLDHGRGFGRPSHDEISILAPLYQCCFISFTTFERLFHLQHSRIRLSSLMRCSLSRDPIAPILLEKHLMALDRRLEIVLKIIKDCLQNHDSKDVLYTEPLEWEAI